MNTDDTICAISSGTGGAIAVIRISGKDALRISQKIWRGNANLADLPNRLLLGKCKSKAGNDSCMAVYMRKPHSYTGEDIVEIHSHGGIIAASILDEIIQNGARQAEPGEFTYRAFMNGKMDLTQAEAVAELISAQSELSARIATRQLDGALKKSIREIRSRTASVLAEIESRLDFPEEDIVLPPKDLLIANTQSIICEIRRLLHGAQIGIAVREGIRIVIAGRPNSGKSSILNRLLGYERAIVTDMPGTTRDTIEEKTIIKGLPCRLIDTAGIREADCIIEKLGIQRALKSVESADIVLWILDSSADRMAELSLMNEHLPKNMKAIAVWNKIDIESPEKYFPETYFPSIKVSALTGEGFDLFVKQISLVVLGNEKIEENDITVSRRHAEELTKACATLEDASSMMEKEDWEIASSCIRETINSLGKITGENADPDILGEIFSRFCIGK